MRTSGTFSAVVAFAMVILSVLSTTAQGATPDASPAASDSDVGLYEAVLDDQRDQVVAATDGDLSLYTIEATIDPGSVVVSSTNATPLPAGNSDAVAVVDGTLGLYFVNDTGVELASIYLRLYPNDPRYGDGGIELTSVTVGGVAVEPILSVDDTVAELPLTSPLPVASAVQVELSFTTTVVKQSDFLAGLLTTSPSLGTISMAHWYPIVAGYDPASGWVLDPVSVNGDLVFSNTALYDVTLVAPEDVSIVTTGSLIAESTEGAMGERRYITGPVREFTVIMDDNLATMEEVVDGTTVAVWYTPGKEAVAEVILTSAVQSLSLFNELFGIYPFETLDLVEADMLGPGGMEYPQIISLDTTLLESPESLESMGFPPRFTEYITVHEVAHQWWYGLVGNNHYEHAFLDEALADASTLIYFEYQYGDEVVDEQIGWNFAPFIGEQVVDFPSDAYPDDLAYLDAVYAKGGMSFLSLRDYIGADVFEEGLRVYAERLRFGVAQPDDLRRILEEVSGMDLEDEWHALFETPGRRFTIPEDIATPAA